ncbi:MAG TPA: hypothetical protein VMC62_06725, partial [Longilinea sp.]|nr:hypothetical protein [Longilinea sp.]
KTGRIFVTIIIVIVALCCLGGGASVLAGGAWALRFSASTLATLAANDLETQTSTLPVLTEESPTATSTMMPAIKLGHDAAAETVATLTDVIVPVADTMELANRLDGEAIVPAARTSPPETFDIGQQNYFWAFDSDTNEYFQAQMVLRYTTAHAYWWIQKGVSYDPKALQEIADAFENQIYPTDRDFFGSEWTPGVDNDPHIFILYVRGVGSAVAGYYPGEDSIPKRIDPYSNEHETLVVNADGNSLSDSFTYGVVAHEFQHMIEWNHVRNEDEWLAEGLADFAILLNHYDYGSADIDYLRDADLQLNDWSDDVDTNSHYGAAFLFVTYFYDRFGKDATQAMADGPESGLASFDEALHEFDIRDPQSHQQVTTEDVFRDWTIANYLQDSSVEDGRFSYSSLSRAQKARVTETTQCPTDEQSRSVAQYGAEYIRLNCKGKFTLDFSGVDTVQVTPADPHSGTYDFWSNAGDDSDMTLSHRFDFTDVSGPISMTYWVWYDLETDYDYVYLSASEDGAHWQIIHTSKCSVQNLSGANYGCGYNGQSSGWVQEKVDLSRFAGKVVDLQFDYVTDAEINGNGLLLDDVSIPAIGYATDFEEDDGGWVGKGFVRIENVLPQTYMVSLIRKSAYGTKVEYLALDADQQLSLPIDFGDGSDQVTLVVSGTTRFTKLPAQFQYSLTP